MLFTVAESSGGWGISFRMLQSLIYFFPYFRVHFTNRSIYAVSGSAYYHALQKMRSLLKRFGLKILRYFFPIVWCWFVLNATQSMLTPCEHTQLRSPALVLRLMRSRLMRSCISIEVD